MAVDFSLDDYEAARERAHLRQDDVAENLSLGDRQWRRKLAAAKRAGGVLRLTRPHGLTLMHDLPGLKPLDQAAEPSANGPVVIPSPLGSLVDTTAKFAELAEGQAGLARDVADLQERVEQLEAPRKRDQAAEKRPRGGEAQ